MKHTKKGDQDLELRKTRLYSQGKRWLKTNMAEVFKKLKGIVRVDINTIHRDIVPD